jgi:hypothetical protein
MYLILYRSITIGVYKLVMPAYDEYPVNTALSYQGDYIYIILSIYLIIYLSYYLTLPSFQVQPKVEILVVEKNLAPIGGYYCGKRNIRGRLVVLHNPLGHFDIVQQTGGCRGGSLSVPSQSGIYLSMYLFLYFLSNYMFVSISNSIYRSIR